MPDLRKNMGLNPHFLNFWLNIKKLLWTGNGSVEAMVTRIAMEQSSISHPTIAIFLQKNVFHFF